MADSKTFFATPQDAEAAFYDALERADLDAMMAVWSEDDETLCVHPGGPRLTGLAAVREGWRQVFQSGERLIVRRSQLVAVNGLLLAVHSLLEHVSLAKADTGQQAMPPVIATNVYQRGAHGWHMLSHHTSPSPPLPDQFPDAPQTLH